MSTPKQKRPKSSKRKKQYRLRLKPVRLSRCPKCKKPTLPHHACRFCGTYNKKEVLQLKLKKQKKKEKSKQKEKKKETKK